MGRADGGPIDTGELPPGQLTLVGYRGMNSAPVHGDITEKYTVKMTGCTMCPIRCYASAGIPYIQRHIGISGSHAKTSL
ncbi:MAG: hypothetical protein GXY67_13770 [Clostridiales bacterium]|nr:hypothetical protein [Clostridiales bacterium]